MTPVTDVAGVGPVLARSLAQLGITSATDLSKTTPEVLSVIPGIGTRRAEILIDAAKAPMPSPKPTRGVKPSSRSAPPETASAAAPPIPEEPKSVIETVTRPDDPAPAKAKGEGKKKKPKKAKKAAAEATSDKSDKKKKSKKKDKKKKSGKSGKKK